MFGMSAKLCTETAEGLDERSQRHLAGVEIAEARVGLHESTVY